MKMKKYGWVCWCWFCCFSSLWAQDLIVRPNDPVIYKKDGDAFLWLGDTAWELFHVLNQQEIVHYLDNRQEKGFTVIQAVLLSELDGVDRPNAYGQLPLIDKNPTQLNEAYFELVDFTVREAGKRGLHMALLPTWGTNVAEENGKPSLFQPDNAYRYGQLLGERYKEQPVIWILGGDRNVVTDREYTIWQALARGLTEGNGGRQLMSYHPTGEISSHYWFHNESWLSFNIVQSGHYRKLDPVYRFAGMYAQLRPVKPFVNAEPSYEDIPVRFWEYSDYEKNGKRKEDVIDERGLVRDTAYFADGIYDEKDIRNQAYWTYLSGAAGYTYGNNAIWQMYKPGGTCHIPCLTFWDAALDRPGAESMRQVKKLFTNYPLDSFEPDLSVLYGINHPDGGYKTAVVAKDRSFVLVYVPEGGEVRLHTDKLAAPGKAFWFNPRDGKILDAGAVANQGIRHFALPEKAAERTLDWILILEAGKTEAGHPRIEKPRTREKQIR